MSNYDAPALVARLTSAVDGGIAAPTVMPTGYRLGPRSIDELTPAGGVASKPVAQGSTGTI